MLLPSPSLPPPLSHILPVSLSFPLPSILHLPPSMPSPAPFPTAILPLFLFHRSLPSHPSCLPFSLHLTFFTSQGFSPQKLSTSLYLLGTFSHIFFLTCILLKTAFHASFLRFIFCFFESVVIGVETHLLTPSFS